MMASFFFYISIFCIIVFQFHCILSQPDILFYASTNSASKFNYNPAGVQFVAEGNCPGTGNCAKMKVSNPASWLETKVLEIDTSGYIDIVLQIDFLLTGFGVGNFGIYQKNDASQNYLSSVIKVYDHDDVPQNTVHSKTFNLNINAENNDKLGIYLMASTTNTGSAYVYVDNMYIFGTKQTTSSPTNNPIPAPTVKPTAKPTKNPTNPSPTAHPTPVPTKYPTVSPTNNPIVSPTANPIAAPTNNPTASPTNNPIISPTANPIVAPTNNPTVSPTSYPSIDPTPSSTDTATVAPTNKVTASSTTTTTTKPPTDASVVVVIAKKPTEDMNGGEIEIDDDTTTTTSIEDDRGKDVAVNKKTDTYISDATIGLIIACIVLLGIIICGAIYFLYPWLKKRNIHKVGEDMLGMGQYNNKNIGNVGHIVKISEGEGLEQSTNTNTNKNGLIIGNETPDCGNSDEFIINDTDDEQDGGNNFMTMGAKSISSVEIEGTNIKRKRNINDVGDGIIDDAVIEDIIISDDTHDRKGNFEQNLVDNALGTDLLMDDIVADMDGNQTPQ